MNLDRYDYTISNDQVTYWFYSDGPKGRIRKRVQFQKASTGVGEMFNLSIADWDEKQQSLSDSTRSNNGDTEKILATVAHIVLDFTENFPNANVIASGTASRIRLYRMNITREYLPILTLFTISGVTENNVVEPFIKNKNYVAIFVKRRSFRRSFRFRS